MIGIVCYDPSDREYFASLLKWQQSLNCKFIGLCCDRKHTELDISKNERDNIEHGILTTDFMIILVGKFTYEKTLIKSEYRNLIAYAISENNRQKKKLLIVKLQQENAVPMEAYGIGAEWAHEFSEEALNRGIFNLFNNDSGFSDWREYIKN